MDSTRQRNNSPIFGMIHCETETVNVFNRETKKILIMSFG